MYSFQVKPQECRHEDDRRKKADQELLLDSTLPGCCKRNATYWLFGSITFQPPTPLL